MLMLSGGMNKIGHLKGQNIWERSGSLDSNQLNIEGLKTAQRNELVVAGQNLTEAYSSDVCPGLIIPEQKERLLVVYVLRRLWHSSVVFCSTNYSVHYSSPLDGLKLVRPRAPPPCLFLLDFPDVSETNYGGFLI